MYAQRIHSRAPLAMINPTVSIGLRSCIYMKEPPKPISPYSPYSNTRVAADMNQGSSARSTKFNLSAECRTNPERTLVALSQKHKHKRFGLK